MAKTKILIIGDSAAVHSGFAKVIRELFVPLHATGHYDIQQVGWFHLDDIEKVPWKIWPTQMGDPGDGSGPRPHKDDAHGEKTGPFVCQAFKPDILWTCADPWMVPHLPAMRNNFNTRWVAQSYIDGGPLLEVHSKAWNGADVIVPVTKFGYDIMNAMKTLDKNKLHQAIGCGVNFETYRPFSPEQRKAVKQKIIAGSPYLSSLKDPVIIGYVGRNQRRKHLPCFYILNAMLRSGKVTRCLECNNLVAPALNYEWQSNGGDKFHPTRCQAHPRAKHLMPADLPNWVLWLHTPPADRGWNLPEMEAAFDLTDKVCHTMGHRILAGIPEKDFAAVYNSFDVYLSFATEGYGLPLVEAAACGIPVISPAFAASRELMEGLGLCWHPHDVYLEDGSALPRPLPDYTEILRLLNELSTVEKRDEYGAAAVRLSKQYSWEKPVAQWDELLTKLAASPPQQSNVFLY